MIYDANKVVCSLPPIINSEHSKITLKTTNIFIDITATDDADTKLEIVTDIMVAMFSRYCAKPFTVEPVKVISEHNQKTRITPSLKPRPMDVEVADVNAITGLRENPAGICKLLEKMQFEAAPSQEDANIIKVLVPPTRADVLHPRDVVGCVCVAYGTLPKVTQESVQRALSVEYR